MSTAPEEILRQKGVIAEFPAQRALLIDPKDHMKTAREFVARHYTKFTKPVLVHQNGAFYGWTGTHYAEIPTADINAALYLFLEGANKLERKGKPVAFKPNRAIIGEVRAAIEAVTLLPSSIAPPCWLHGAGCGFAADEIIACTNGLLHLKSQTMLPLTPDFYTLNALDYAFDQDASEPKAWKQFLSELWDEDSEAIKTLQEMYGYFLTADTRQQKAFLITGPKRSGKGTAARVLTSVLGRHNVVNPTLSGLATNFGLQPLIGKRLAIISDARLGNRGDQQVIAERLLSISGEDGQTIDRKFLASWDGQLQTRFLILSNELPRFSDTSGALASRFVVMTLTRSFLGAEDPGLTERLLAERPGILNWAIDGWHRLVGRGHFVQPTSSAESIHELEALASPVGAFLEDQCIRGAGLSVTADGLFNAWKDWCTKQGRDHPGTASVFGRDLRAVMPGIMIRQARSEGARYRVYEGLALKDGDYALR